MRALQRTSTCPTWSRRKTSVATRLLRHCTRPNGSAHARLAQPATIRRPTTGVCWPRRRSCAFFRDDPERLQELDLLHRAKASHEEALHPPAATERFVDPVDVQRAWDAHTLQPLPDEPARLGFAVDRTMGELASQLGQPKELYRGLRAEALALLVYLAGRVQEISHATQPLEVTSAVRDEAYQELLRDGNPEATQGYSLHTTGYASTSAAATNRARRRRRSSSCSTTSRREA